MIEYKDGKHVIKNGDQEIEVTTQRAGEIARRLRVIKIDNLVAQLPIFGLHLSDLEKIFVEFKGSFFSYTWLGTDTFKTELTNYNTAGEVLTILNTVANPANGFTIRDSILYELNK